MERSDHTPTTRANGSVILTWRSTKNGLPALWYEASLVIVCIVSLLLCTCISMEWDGAWELLLVWVLWSVLQWPIMLVLFHPTTPPSSPPKKKKNKDDQASSFPIDFLRTLGIVLLLMFIVFLGLHSLCRFLTYDMFQWWTASSPTRLCSRPVETFGISVGIMAIVVYTISIVSTRRLWPFSSV